MSGASSKLEADVITYVMMLQNVESMSPYPRQLLLVFLQSAMNSPELNQTKKVLIEDLCQKIVGAWTNKDLV